MSERKVLTKHYPIDFDPKLVPKVSLVAKKTVKTRLMLPFSCQCLKCGEFMYIGRKFNGRKENSGEKYLNIIIWRFYFRCSRCLAEITFKIDPKNRDYICEHGATRTFDMKQEFLQSLAEQKEKAEQEASINAIEALEKKASESRRQAQDAAEIDELYQSSIQRINADLTAVLEAQRIQSKRADEAVEAELEEEARKLFIASRLDMTQPKEGEGGMPALLSGVEFGDIELPMSDDDGGDNSDDGDASNDHNTQSGSQQTSGPSTHSPFSSRPATKPSAFSFASQAAAGGPVGSLFTFKRPIAAVIPSKAQQHGDGDPIEHQPKRTRTHSPHDVVDEPASASGTSVVSPSPSSTGEPQVHPVSHPVSNAFSCYDSSSDDDNDDNDDNDDDNDDNDNDNDDNDNDNDRNS